MSDIFDGKLAEVFECTGTYSVSVRISIDAEKCNAEQRTRLK